jgi:hypothetical protein
MIVKAITWLRCETKEIGLHLNIKYDVFSVEDTEGTTMAVYATLRDQPSNALKYVIADAIRRRFGSKCENMNQVYQMMLKTWPNKDTSIIQMIY